MKVWIHGFRHYKDKHFEFDAGNVYLISGRSGTGKSTILQAATWCLYGTIKETSPHDEPNAKMWVQIELDGYIIYRQRNPCLLRLSNIVNTGLVLEGPVAQAEIDNHFGAQSIWESSCYLEQKENHILLSAPAQAKMNLLNKFAYKDDDPKKYINMIVDRIKQIENDLSVSQQSYKYDVENFNNMRSKYTVDMSHYKTEEEIMAINQEISKLTFRSDCLRSELVTLQSNEVRRNTLIGQIKPLNDSIRGIAYVSKESIDERSRRSSLYTDSQNFLRIIQDCERELNNLPVVVRPCDDNIDVKLYSQDELNNLMYQMQRHELNKNCAIQNGVEYNKSSIDKEIERISEILSHQYKFQLNDQLSMLQSMIQKTPIDESCTKDILDNLNEKKINMEKSRTVLECPGCKLHVKNVGGHLVEAHESLFDVNGYNDLINEINRVSMNINLAIDRKNKENQLNIFLSTNGLSNSNPVDIPTGIMRLNHNQIQQFQQKISNLKNIIILDSVDIVYPQSCNRWHSYMEKKRLLEKKLEEAKKTYLNHGVYEAVDNIQLEKDKSNNVKIDTVNQQLAMLESQLINILEGTMRMSEISQEIKVLGDNVVLLKNTVEMSKIANMIIDQHRILSSRYENINKTAVKLAKVQRLKQMTIAKECNDLSLIVARINRFMDLHAKTIFSVPISLELSLFKTVKATGLDKPQVNLHILYRGGDLTSLKSLSGGEVDRINLLLALALHDINGKILMLDETLASVDDDTKIQCNKLIRHVVCKDEAEDRRGVVIIASHGTCDGLYDKVIDMEAIEIE